MFKRLVKLCQPHKVTISIILVICLGVVLPFAWFLQREPGALKEPLPIAFFGGNFMQKSRMSSMRAIMDNYNRGITTFQISMGFNKNNDLACKRVTSLWGMNPGNGEQAIYGGEVKELSDISYDFPCTAAELTAWLLENGNAQIIVDMQDDPLRGLNVLKEKLPSYQKQVIVQLSDVTNYSAIRDLGYAKFVYLVRDFRKDPRELIGDINGKHFQAVVLPMQLVERNMVRRLQRHNIQTYAYVIDNCEMLASLGIMGVDGVYSNVIGPGSCDRRNPQFRSVKPWPLSK